jgi:hypothetical protein
MGIEVPMAEETVFGKAVDEFYNKKLSSMTDSLVVVLQRAESPVVRRCGEHDVPGGRGGHQEV